MLLQLEELCDDVDNSAVELHEELHEDEFEEQLEELIVESEELLQEKLDVLSSIVELEDLLEQDEDCDDVLSSPIAVKELQTAAPDV